jgi:hypothetical protein
VHLRRLRAGEWLAAAGGILLIVSLFLSWWEVPVDLPAAEIDSTKSAYQALSVIDILLTLIALLAISLPVLQATQDAPNKPVGAAVLTVVAGALAVLLALFRLIDSPIDGASTVAGPWVALVAAIALTAGAWLSLAAEYVRGLPPDLEPELRATPAP